MLIVRLDPNTFARAAFGAMLRMFFGSCSLCFLMYTHNFFITCVLGIGPLPIICCRLGLIFIAFMKAADGLRFFFVVFFAFARVVRRFGAAFLRVVALRVVLFAVFLLVVFLLVVAFFALARFGAAFLRVVLFLFVVAFLRVGAFLRAVVFLLVVFLRAVGFLRVVAFLLVVAFLRVVVLRATVLRFFGAAARFLGLRAVDFLLLAVVAMVSPLKS